ncbi:glycine zipper 2TM domain-containing protein [Acidovorax kalamii]|uniref:glycine zipper 2TM domain-containing protein n=1 Tax=Acidovorax kalamii TaxID=2004485 RepID=UPI002091D246|nr:glycine zipper 2TM domain-containing protein [Acidovorax kalamii]MCO5354495.1 glycine zipper 2TM domain-containing protein [Acidovorax kalamii]
MLQFTRRPLAIAGVVVLAGSLAACGHNRPAPAPQYSGGYSSGYQTAPAYPNNPVGTEYGRVSNIEVMQGRSQGQTSGAGAVLGAVVGGVLGNQVGKGSGRAAATAVGVLGGAVAGNAIEGRNNQEYAQGYRLSIHLDQGGYRVYDVSSPGDLRIGDRVRLYNGQISRL